MVTHEDVRATILHKITTDDVEVRASYLKHFGPAIDEFAGEMTQAFLSWRSFDIDAQKDVTGPKGHVD